jgi:hypothetical protein
MSGEWAMMVRKAAIWLGLFTAFFMLSLIAPERAQAAGCTISAQLPSISVNIVPWQIRYDYTRTQIELSALVQKQAWLTADHRARGLYDTELMHRSLIDFNEQQGGWNGDNCLGLSRVAIDLSYHDPVIYLAKELAWARCVAIEVRSHEQKHASTDRDLIYWFKSYLEGELIKWAARQNVVELADLRQGKQEMVASLDGVMANAIAVFAKERARRQALIDTPQEYQRIELACPNN